MLRRLLRKRTWDTPEPGPSTGHAARRAVLDAAQRMSEIIAQQPRVTETAARLERVERENRLVPRISAALGAHSDS
jgi:hypothetical protein